MKAYKSFVFMFYAMDAAYEEKPDINLGNYLSGLNPFLFKGIGSADPAEYKEFKNEYIRVFGEREVRTIDIYKFCREYLKKNAPKEAIAAFEQIKKEDWIYEFENSEL